MQSISRLPLFLALLLPLFALGKVDTFVNPFAEGADPWVVRHEDKYLLCASDGNAGVAIWVSDRLTAVGEKHVIFEAPERGPHSRRWWAPELHFLEGKWYVYVATSHGDDREAIAQNTRMVVLESETFDPLSHYHLKNQLFTGDDLSDPRTDRWAIDGTVLEHEGQLYFIWSGWLAFANNQHTYIARMSNPWTISSGRVLLAENDDYLWERVGESLEERGLNEGPEILKHNGRVFIIYSASGSWQTSYKLGLLELQQGGDPMNPAHWKKHPEPVFEGNELTYGIGHNSFVTSPDGSENWIIYHAKQDRKPGWRRVLCAQPFSFDETGWPVFGEPAKPGEALAVPSGQQFATESGVVSEDFKNGWARWAYYGHHQEIAWESGQLELMKPLNAVNSVKAAPKLVLKDHDWADAEITVRMRATEDAGLSGVLFRVSDPWLGTNTQKAYYAAIQTRDGTPGSVVLGLFDGDDWTVLARRDASLPTATEHQLRIVAKADLLRVEVDGEEMLQVRDSTFESGSVGLRSANGGAVFAEVSVRPLSTQATLSSNPLPVALGDPYVMLASDGKYYMYGTDETGKLGGFAAYSSDDLSTWNDEGQVYQGNTDSSWTLEDFWAPEVYERDGKFYMLFSADWKHKPNHEKENFRIGVAVSESPTGPFRDLTVGPLFDPGYPIIDANLLDHGGKTYLYYSRCCYKHPVESEVAEWAQAKGLFEEIEESWVYGVEVAKDLTHVIGEPVLLLKPPFSMDDTQAELESRSVTSGEVNRRWTEGSYAFSHGDKIYMMYSANFFGGQNYAVGYAVSEHPLGPFLKSNRNPVLQKNTEQGGLVTGTGHNSITWSKDGEQMYCVYHGRTSTTGHKRVVFIDKMHIDPAGNLIVEGPTTGDRN